jgi:hypothetical protein
MRHQAGEAADRLNIRLSAGQRAGPDSVTGRIEDTTDLAGSGAAKFTAEEQRQISPRAGRERHSACARMDTSVVNDEPLELVKDRKCRSALQCLLTPR